MSQSVSVVRRDDVLVVRLSRPGARNAIDVELARGLGDALRGAASPDVGAVALLADGDHFCVGGDVRAMAAAADPSAFVQMLAEQFHTAVQAVGAAPPVVTGVCGWAAGAGFSLALATDIVIAGEGARFQSAYPGIGASPDGGLTWTLPRAVGHRRARSILLRNTVIPAAEALELGLVDRVVPDADVETAVLAEAATLAGAARGAQRATKALLASSPDARLVDHLHAEAESIAACIASPEGREGLGAFLGRRRPDFEAARAGRTAR